ncbi:MAG: hypothetical protein U0905_15470 [Pirellulales bacterium]
MRVRHDLLGCANRLKQTSSEFQEAVAVVLEHWRDARAARFEREDLREIDQVIDQLTVYLQKAADLVGKIDRELRDQDGD